MAKENRGRNDIVRALNQEGIKISAGSVSNIIVESRKQKTLFKSNTSTKEENQDRQTERVTTFPIESLAEIEFKKEDISIENHVISNTSDFEENGYPVVTVGRKGGPLSWFTKDNGHDAIINSATSMNIDAGSPLLDGIGKAAPEYKIVNIQSDVIKNQYAKKDVEFETEEETFDYQSRIRTSAPTYQGPSVAADTKPLVDWDSDENFERRFLRMVFDDKKERARQLQAMEQYRLELEEGRHQIEQMKQSIEQRENNLKVREAKVADIESLAPSVRQLQQMHVTFDMMMSYILLVNERSVLGNVSTRSAALSLSHDFKEYRSLGNILKAKQKAEKELAELNTLTAQKQAALNDITERLTQLTGPSYNGNNGYGGNLSMYDLIRLNLLKSTTERATNILNRVGMRTTH